MSAENNKARQFADNFNQATANVCEDDGSTDADSLKSTWESLVTKFNGLATTVQNELKVATSDETTEIGLMIARYEYIYAKYGEALGLNNFLGKTISSAALASYGDDGALLTGGIVTISIVAIVTIGLVSARSFRRKRG